MPLDHRLWCKISAPQGGTRPEAGFHLNQLQSFLAEPWTGRAVPPEPNSLTGFIRRLPNQNGHAILGNSDFNPAGSRDIQRFVHEFILIPNRIGQRDPRAAEPPSPMPGARRA